MLVEHLALAVQVKKDIIQSLLPLLPKFPRDKACSLKLLDTMAALAENTEKAILENAHQPQDVFVLPTY